MKRSLFFAICLLYALGSVAQESQVTDLTDFVMEGFTPASGLEDPVADSVYIREIEILARRRLGETGFRITRPDSLAIHSGLSSDLSELLTAHSPVFVKSYGPGSQATAHFRGTSASHTLIVWNGINLNSPMRGTTDLSQVPLFFIDGVYLLHGGSSLSQGSGALGGSIHLENQPDWKHKNQLLSSVEAASFQTGRYAVKVQTGTDNFKSVTRLYVEHSANTFPFFNTGVIPNKQDTLNNGSFRKNGLLQEFYFRTPSEITFTLRGWLQNNNRNLPPLMSYEGSHREETQRDAQQRYQFEAKKYTPRMNFQYNAGYTISGMDYSLAIVQNRYQVTDAKSVEKKLYNVFRVDYQRSHRLFFSTALEAGLQQVETREKVKGEGYREKRFESGWLLQMHYKVSEFLALFLLSRSEIYDNQFIPLIPSAGGEWQLSRAHPVLLKFNLTRNYHKPGLNDLYWLPGGNPGLLPEEGVTGELAVSSRNEGNNFSIRQEISGYGSVINNQIMWQPAENGAWYWEAVNLNKVISRGIEYDFSATFHYRKMNFSGHGNYALTRSYRSSQGEGLLDSEGKQLIYIPLHAANLRLGAGREGWMALVHLGYTGRRYTQTSNAWTPFDNSLDPFMITNLSVQKSFIHKHFEWSVKAKVENLFNARYQQILWRPMPGRNYSITITTGFLK